MRPEVEKWVEKHCRPGDQVYADDEGAFALRRTLPELGDPKPHIVWTALSFGGPRYDQAARDLLERTVESTKHFLHRALEQTQEDFEADTRALPKTTCAALAKFDAKGALSRRDRPKEHTLVMKSKLEELGMVERNRHGLQLTASGLHVREVLEYATRAQDPSPLPETAHTPDWSARLALMRKLRDGKLDRIPLRELGSAEFVAAEELEALGLIHSDNQKVQLSSAGAEALAMADAVEDWTLDLRDTLCRVHGSTPLARNPDCVEALRNLRFMEGHELTALGLTAIEVIEQARQKSPAAAPSLLKAPPSVWAARLALLRQLQIHSVDLVSLREVGPAAMSAGLALQKLELSRVVDDQLTLTKGGSALMDLVDTPKAPWALLCKHVDFVRRNPGGALTATQSQKLIARGLINDGHELTELGHIANALIEQAKRK